MFKKTLSLLLVLLVACAVFAVMPLGIVAVGGTDGTVAETYVAQVGDMKYESLQAAIDDAQDDVTIKLIQNILLDDINDVEARKAASNGNGIYCGFDYGNGAFFNVIDKDVTVDLNGYTITYDIHDTAWCNKRVVSVFYATDKSNLTITDSSEAKTGAVTVNGMATAVYSVAVDTNVTVEGGTWTWNKCKTCGATNAFLYASHGGVLQIEGGNFVNNVEGDSGDYMFFSHYSSEETTENSAGVDYDQTKIAISGGTFENCNPGEIKYMDQGNSNKETVDTGCAEGFVPVENTDGSYGVKEWYDENATTLYINNIYDLLAFAEKANSGVNFSGKTVELTADINLAGIEWAPIGGDNVYFAGEFDGNCKTISNLTQTKGSRMGLFGLVEKCYIHDVTLENVSFTINENNARVGAVAGNLQYWNVVEDVTIDGIKITLNGNDGLVGAVSGYVWKSQLGNVDVKNAEFIVNGTGNVIGGHTAYGRAHVWDTNVTGNNANWLEGTVQTINGTEYVLQNYFVDCDVDGVKMTLNGTGSEAGGFFGSDTYNSHSNYFVDCHVTGLDVTAAEGTSQIVGGFIAWNNGTTAAGTAKGFDNCSAIGTINGANGIYGGFAGQVGGRACEYYNASADVDIVCTGTAGGFVGATQAYSTHKYTFADCSASGDVTANVAGGFAGKTGMSGDGKSVFVELNGCEASGTVVGSTYAGGLIGEVNTELPATNWNTVDSTGNLTLVGNTAATNVSVAEGGKAGALIGYLDGVANGDAKEGNTLEVILVGNIPSEGINISDDTIKEDIKSDFVASVGNVYYESFADALDAAQALNATTTEDVVVNVYETIILDQDAEYDFTGLRFNAVGITNAPVFRILANVTFKGGIVDGRGPVAGEGGINCYAFIVGNSTTAGTLTITNGTYRGVTSAISITNGTVNISGGVFQTGHDEEGTDYGATYLLNCMDSAYKAGTAKYNITGGRFNYFNPADNAAEGAGTNFVADGYKASYNENDGTYTVEVTLPEVVITDIKNTLEDSDPDLTFALNFAIKDMENLTEDYLEDLLNKYGNHYVDYVLTIGGLSQDSVTFNANGNADGWLAGQYDGFGPEWLSVPFEDVTVQNGESLYIMEYAAKLMGQSGLRFTLAEVAAIVQNFDCGVYFTPEFLAANPGLTVTLELKVFTEDENGNKLDDISVATNEFDVEDVAAIVTGEGKQTKYFATFDEAYKAAQNGDTIELLKDVKLTEKLTVTKPITIDGKGHSIIADHAAFILETSSDCTFKNITLNTNNKAKGVKIASGNVVFENVTIPNSNKSDAITVNGTLTIKEYFSVESTYQVFDARNGSVTVEPGTVFDFTSRIGLVSPATSDLKGAVDTEGNPFFCAYGSTTYYKTLSSSIIPVTDLTLLDDIALQSNLTVSGTLNLNGHNLTIADGKQLKVSGNLTIAGEGNLEGDFVLASETATIAGDEGLDVTTTVADHKVVYENGVYSLVAKVYVAQNGETKYETLKEAIDKATAGDTIVLLKEVTENVTINKNLTIDGANFKYTGEIKFVNQTVTIQNVNFVNGNINQSGSGNGGTLTVKNCTFNGNNTNGTYPGYAIHVARFGHVIVEECSTNGIDLLYVRLSTLSVSVTGGKISNDGGWGAHIVPDCTVKFDGVTFENLEGGFVVQNPGASKKVTIKDCQFINNDYPVIVWNKTGNVITFNFEGVSEMNTENWIGRIDNNSYPLLNGFDVAKVTGVQVGTKIYATLADAFAAANDGDTITLLGDTTLETMIVNNKNVTLDLNGKTITGKDTTSKNFSLIDNRGELTITGNGTMTLTATQDTGTSRYSAVIANNPGGKLIVENGTIEHLGGTYMAYGIDNLTNGKGTYAETVINGGTIKSTYRGIRQFLNGVEAQNILTINGGTVEGVDKSIFFHDPSKNANSGTLTVGENAILNGDVYLFVTEGSTEWPVEISIAAAALAEGSEITTKNVPAQYAVANVNGVYQKVAAVASVGNTGYATLGEAIAAAKDGETVILLQNINIANEKLDILDGSYDTYFKVEGKSIIVDLNEKTISGEYTGTGMLVGVFSTENDGHLVLTGNGTVDITAGGNVYSLIANYEPGCSIVIENGTYKLDKASDSLIYSGCSVGENEGVTVKDGYFWLGNVGSTGNNGKPWIFNCLGSNERHVDVYGGTFNADIANQYWRFEVQFPDKNAVKNNGDGTWTVVEAVCYITEIVDGYNREVYYATVADALAAAKSGQTVMLMTDATESIVMITKGVTLDLNGNTLTADYFVAFNGNHVVDNSTDKAGLLVIDKNNISLAVNNAQMPVWTTDGYKFATMNMTQYKEDANRMPEDGFAIKFKPSFSKKFNDTYFADGAIDNGIKIVVRLTWYDEVNKIQASQDFVYNEDFVKEVYSENGAFSLIVSGISDMTNVNVSLYVISDIGVEAVASNIYTYNPTTGQ